jgi:hypothetical protein
LQHIKFISNYSKGRNNKFKHKIKEVMTPTISGLFMSVNKSDSLAAHHTNKPTDNADTNSTTGKKRICKD